jgi:hypothetical protein
VRKSELHLLVLHVRAGLQLRDSCQRMRQHQLHLHVLHVRAGLQLRFLSKPTGSSVGCRGTGPG